MPAASLKDMALRAVKRNIKEIDDLGSLPSLLFGPIIDAVVDPAHLLKLQQNSPHLAEHTVDKWREFLTRDVPSWTRNQVYPREPKLWCKVYFDEKQRVTEEAEGMLRAGYASIAAKRTQQRTYYVPELILPSTKNSKVSKRAPARSAITNAVMRDVAKNRMLRAPFKVQPPRPLRHDGIAPSPVKTSRPAFDAVLSQKQIERRKQSPVIEDDPLGLWGPPTKAKSQQITPPVQNEAVRSPVRATVTVPLASPVSRSSPIEPPTTPIEKGSVRILKRAPASITRGVKRTRFS